MLRYPESTPCPVASNLLTNGSSLRDDATEELDFTTEFQAALRNAGPRRRKSTAPTAHHLSTMSQCDATEHTKARDLPSREGAPLGGIAAKAQPDHLSNAQHLGLALAPARRRASQLLTKCDDYSAAEHQAPPPITAGSNVPNVRKRPRRRTIYIPSDDTTIITIHPGIQADTTGLSGISLQPEQNQVNERILSRNDQGLEKRGDKRMSLAAAPRRVPLQPTLKPLQEADDQKNKIVAGSGKENLPPGLSAYQKAKALQAQFPRARRVSIFQPISEDVSKPEEHTDRPIQAVGAERRAGLSVSSSLGAMTAKSVHNKDRRASMMNRRNSLYYGTSWKGVSDVDGHPVKEVLSSTRLVAAAIPRDSLHQRSQYQILQEDIEKPEMFEDAWLNDQESALQQLVNRLFETAHEKVPLQEIDRTQFRAKLLRLYQDSDCALIYKRLQASLLYGALNPPKGSIADTSRLKTDVGLRQRFLAIWLGTYDLEALMSAAEVVVGRSISSHSYPPQSGQPASHNTDDTRLRKRSTGLFIESCLLRNEDAHDEADLSNSLWCWRRTMLRCLMMVLLLDKAKDSGVFPRKLFQRASKFKSSRDVLGELSTVISPFLGEISRSLSHLWYHVHHIQFPLSEYRYRIENLATELRDGVQLTHLVELLLYSPESPILSREDITVSMPTGEVLISSHGRGESWPLSQHLKFPCLTSTQRIYNVQVALSALHIVRGVGNIVEGIKAEDIVNGHREKTVTLLWSLVGKWGIETMVDFEHVQKEIRRLSRKGGCDDQHTSDAEGDLGLTLKGPAKHTYLLKTWARVIARRHGLHVSNLTTTFSDGRVFAAIVDEYQRYLPKRHSSRSLGTGQLEAKLRDIGCSDAFASIFGRPDQGRIFDRDFTLAALAFLCSRLLRASRRGIAAEVILRAYHRSKVRQNIRQRCVLLRRAHDCQSVHSTRGKVICAARVLQRGWRGYLRQKHHGSNISQRRIKRKAIEEERHGHDDHVDIWLR